MSNTNTNTLKKYLNTFKYKYKCISPHVWFEVSIRSRNDKNIGIVGLFIMFCSPNSLMISKSLLCLQCFSSSFSLSINIKLRVSVLLLVILNGASSYTQYPGYTRIGLVVF